MSETIAFVELMGTLHNIDKAFDDLMTIEEVKAVHAVTGQYDFLTEVRCSSIWELTKIMDKITCKGWITGTRTSKVKNIAKEPKEIKFVPIDVDKEKELLITSLRAMVGINVRSGLYKPLLARLRDVDEIKRIYLTTGEHDVLLEIEVKNMYEFSKVIEAVHSYEYLASTDTAFVLRMKHHIVYEE